MRRNRRSRPKARGRETKVEVRTLEIDRLGRAGDGMAGDLAVPFTLPGERVRAEVQGRQARLVEVERPHPERAEPRCPHFGLHGDACGGCRMQQMQDAGLTAWKVRRLTEAAIVAFGSAPEPDIHTSPPMSRRRAKFAFRRVGKGWQAGFRAFRSHQIVPVTACAVLRPDLLATAQAFAEALPPLMPASVKAFDAWLTATDTGIEIAAEPGIESDLDLAGREAAAAIADALDLARLAFDGVPLVMRRPPRIELGGVEVLLPIAPFLQATAEGQDALVARVMAAAEGCRRIADLYSGIGTFTLPLSTRAEVVAHDGAADAVAALAAAGSSARRAVRAETRDLDRRPLTADELRSFDAAVLDPPRNGAAAQVEVLAEAGPPRLILVSCDPDSLSRDAARLSARYELTSLSLIDQFRWSPHIEAVAVLDRR
jgi:23S rRNA (uracil1939-C5)-methyltransferase